MSKQNIKILTYSDSYKSKIINLILKIQMEEFGFITTINDPLGLESITSFYQENGGNFWVALDGEDVVGTIGLRILSNGQAAIKRMYVAKDCRGKNYGVAKLLLDNLIDLCKQKQVKELYLGTRAAYLAAHRFYEKNEFKEVLKAALPTRFPIASVDTKFYKRNVLF